jgi:hypothetical protein
VIAITWLSTLAYPLNTSIGLHLTSDRSQFPHIDLESFLENISGPVLPTYTVVPNRWFLASFWTGTSQPLTQWFQAGGS